MHNIYNDTTWLAPYDCAYRICIFQSGKSCLLFPHLPSAPPLTLAMAMGHVSLARCLNSEQNARGNAPRLCPRVLGQRLSNRRPQQAVGSAVIGCNEHVGARCDMIRAACRLQCCMDTCLSWASRQWSINADILVKNLTVAAYAPALPCLVKLVFALDSYCYYC